MLKFKVKYAYSPNGVAVVNCAVGDVVDVPEPFKSALLARGDAVEQGSSAPTVQRKATKPRKNKALSMSNVVNK